MVSRIQLRRDTAANWTSTDPTLAQGEFGYETDTDKFKMGDGSTAWTSLTDYYEPSNNLILDASQVEIEEIGTATYDDVQDIINTWSSGIITGGVISDSGSGQIDVSAGTGMIKTTDSAIGVTQSFDWSLTENITLTDVNVNYIYINYNAGSPVVAATIDRTTIEQYRQFTLGRVYRSGTTLSIINSGTRLTSHNRGTHERLVYRGVQHADGAVISETGTRNIESTAGVLYLGNNKLTTTTRDTSGADLITRWYHSSGSWTTDTNAQVDNTYYDNGTDRTELAVNRYGVHWIFVCGCGGDLKLVYGQGSYTLADAENASVPSSLPDCIDKLAILAAKIIIQKSDSSFTSIVSAYETLFPVSSPSNHNDLGGIQGGAADDYYHLTSAHHTDLTDGNECTIHKHAATQIADGTVSDTEFQYINTLASNAQDQITARVTNAMFDANTILKADSDNTPAALTVAEQTLVGRITAGVITALTATQVRTLINVADGANDYTHPNHTGEVTSTGDGATVIVDDAVTYAKMQNVVADERILGNVTASDSVVEELTKAQVLTMLNVADGADVTGDNAPQAHDLDSHNSCTLAELSADITDATLTSIAGTETLTNKTIELDDALGVDHTYEGTTIDDTVGESVVFGDLLYMKSDGKWWKGSSAVASSAECPIEAMAVATITADAAGKLLLCGTARDDSWDFTTMGKVYAGIDVPTHTIPTTSGHTVQIIGTSLDADRMIFKPNSTYIELS